MKNSQYLINKLNENSLLSEDEFILLLSTYNNEDFLYAKSLSQDIAQKVFGNKIYIRALIEFTNYCKNDCYYCGIQNSNHNIKRYRLTLEEIMECCHVAYDNGFRTFVLQGGEDPYFTQNNIIEIIQNIKGKYPDSALTLSIGEKSKEEYQAYHKFGINRFLLRHETADSSHYNLLHPSTMTLENRKNCLYNLKEIGIGTGAGFMIGSPFQEIQSIAKDFVFLGNLQPHMVGMGPFIPHKDTVFCDRPAGSLEFTLFLISLVRIMLKNVLLPATTALETIDKNGRELGILHGANVVMLNVSPEKNRKEYSLYDNKSSDGREIGESLKNLQYRLNNIKYEISYDIGNWSKRL